MQTRLLKLAVPLVIAVLVAIAPFVIADRFLLKVFTFVGLNVIVVTGLALLFGYAGQVSLGHAAFVGIGAYTMAYMTATMKLPWTVAFVASALLAGVGGLLLAVPALRLKGHYLAMATLGFGELMSLVFAEAVPITRGVDGFSGIPFPTIGGLVLRQPAQLYWLVWGVAGLALLGTWSMVRLGPGRAMRALHGSELGASAAGVDVAGTKIRAFVASAALAGVSGALYASVVGFISPSVFTLQSSVMYLAMAVIGGVASLSGPVLAATLLTLVQYTDALLPGLPQKTAETIQQFQPDVYGLAIVLVVMFAPGGIASLWKRRQSRGEAS